MSDMENKKMKPEILAPAGSMDALKAAVFAGADAVYLGGSKFGARAFADNFEETALIQAIEYCHIYGVKVYLTVNTLFRNEEIKELYDYLEPFYKAGLDAVIVQDLGVMLCIHRWFPKLPIHASTQMTITTEYAYTLLKDYGVTRIVPARELSMEEIKGLKTGIEAPEVEVFVQGALCYCYSGQCLMSSMLGGRSGNRGRCAQTCRLPYRVFDAAGQRIDTAGAHILSPKDLCGLEAVPELIRAGVDSFKIEGRMKKPEYVAVCVRAYREIVGAVLDGRYSPELVDAYKSEMAEVFNRGGFTKGYYYQKNGRDMMSVKNPGNTGVLIGNVTDIYKNQIQIKLKKPVYKGDILVLDGKKDKITLTCNVDAEQGKKITLNVPKKQEIVKNAAAARMLLKPLMNELGEIIQQEPKLPLTGRIELLTGFPAKLTLSVNIKGREYSITQTGEMVEKASARPVTKELVMNKIGKTGNTRYFFKDFENNISADAFYSLKDLKDLRRNAIRMLELQILSSGRRFMEKRADMPEGKDMWRQSATNRLPQPEDEQALDVTVMVSGIQQFNAVKKDSRIRKIYLDLQYFKNEDIITIISDNREKELYLVLPPVLRRGVLEDVAVLSGLKKQSISGVVVRNLDELAYLYHTGYWGKIITDNSLYVMNDYAAAFIRSVFPDARVTVPVELNQRQIKKLSFIQSDWEMEVYGYQQLMVSAQCLQNTVKHCSHTSETFRMQDRYHKSFFVSCICKYCYNIIYNGIPTVLFDLMQEERNGNGVRRLHFTKESEEEVQKVLDVFFGGKGYDGDKTRGHYNRGVE